MSLQQLAQHIQSRGRGEDKMLVHMTPSEVGGLQSLAMAHGGSLTINPETGLPEASFLAKILPTIIGAGVGIATMNPMLGAAAGGAAGMAFNKGSLQAGLMAGLGSYGLGSLGVGLAGAGAASAAGAGAGFGATGLTPAATAGAVNAFEAALPAVEGAGAGVVGGMAPMGAAGSGLASAGGALPSSASTFDNIRAGIGAVGEQPGGWGQFMKSNMLPIGAAGAGLLSMGSGSGSGSDSGDDNQTPSYIRPFDVQTQVNGPSYTPGTPYLTRTFTPQEPVLASEWGNRSFADGGIARLAAGGYGNDVTENYPANRYGVTGNTPLLAGQEQYNQDLVSQTPQYLLPENNPSNIFGTTFNPYTPMGFQGYGQNRYGPPTAQTNMPVVDQFNQSLADQANLEYMGQPTLSAFLSKQRKELQRAYDEILKRAPDAVSQKRYLDQMDQGATIDEIKKQMEENPPPVPTINPTFDATPNQNAVSSNLGVVETPYGTPGAVETSAAVNRDAVNNLAAIESANVAGVAPTTPTTPVVDPNIALEAERKRLADAEAARLAGEQAAQAQAAAEAQARWEEQQRQAAAAAEANRASEAAAEAERKRVADAAATPKQKDLTLDMYGDYIGTEYGGQYYNNLKNAQRLQAEGRRPDIVEQQMAEARRLSEEMDKGNYYGPNYQGDSWASGDGGAAGGMPGVDFARYAGGGISALGSYSDGGRLLKGPGDGVSDNIPAMIGNKQPARLADGEFVVPARIVSEIGNGSTDAGAKRLYAMMDKIQKTRQKTVGKGKVAVDSKAYKHLPT